MARSSTPKIRQRNIRTSIRSTLRLPTGKALWQEIKSIFEFWIEQGVRIFRVDNPHTKPFAMWEWLIAEVKKHTPNAIFLAEAFTRPKVMHRLAKLGYNQSYTYYAWRNNKWELTEYLNELTKGPGREYFRPNFWPNTPDILTEYLQFGGRPAFMSRLVMAATMTANYGIYGPAYEMMEHIAVKHGSEEYLDSEKYQLRYRSFQELDSPSSLRDFIALVNRIRKRNPALQSDWSLTFHGLDNEQVLCYSKATDNRANVILVVVNLDPNYTQAGWTDLDLGALGVDSSQPFQVHDLLTGAIMFGVAHTITWNSTRIGCRPMCFASTIIRTRSAISIPSTAEKEKKNIQSCQRRLLELEDTKDETTKNSCVRHGGRRRFSPQPFDLPKLQAILTFRQSLPHRGLRAEQPAQLRHSFDLHAGAIQIPVAD
jgi:hypothetical protein